MLKVRAGDRGAERAATIRLFLEGRNCSARCLAVTRIAAIALAIFTSCDTVRGWMDCSQRASGERSALVTGVSITVADEGQSMSTIDTSCCVTTYSIDHVVAFQQRLTMCVTAKHTVTAQSRNLGVATFNSQGIEVYRGVPGICIIIKGIFPIIFTRNGEMYQLE